jgi:tRNA(Ile)-lysidine synthase
MQLRRSANAPLPRKSALPAANPLLPASLTDTGSMAPPLTLADLDASLEAIGGFEPRPLIAVGVSGGPDSMALAILADRWARARGGAACALIVDHRLRPESPAEAETVGAWLAGRGIAHAVLVWRGPKPATGIQEAARAARYRLLGEWCAARGCLHLLTAHHRDDQVETYLIRRRAGSGVDGLAGMSAVRELRQLRLVRPLLGIPKARLVAFLEAEGQAYVQDPSNRNVTFERARLRLEPRQEEAARTLAAIRANATARVGREHDLAALLARTTSLHPAGFAVLDPEPIVAAGELGERALDRVASVIGGSVYPLRRERLARLRRALAATPSGARTLGGCRFVPWRGRVLALREMARAAPPLSLKPGMSALWDRRFALTLPAASPGPITVGPLGATGVAELGRALDEDNPFPRFVFPVLPAGWDNEGLAAVPHLSWQRATETCLPTLAFRPAVSLIESGFTVV